MPITKVKTQLYAACPGCTEKSHRVDQMEVNQSTIGTCGGCRNQFRIVRLNENEVQTELTGRKETPVTVTLRSPTEPPITLKLNTWRYAHSQNDQLDEYTENQRYFYNEHTCPTNWASEIANFEFQGDLDPHGVFQFVSVEDGHFGIDADYDALDKAANK